MFIEFTNIIRINSAMCIFCFMNAFNMLDGINLQAGMYSCFILIVLILFGMDLLLGLIIIFSILVFLKLNYQNKIFLGDNGTLLLSYIFSYLFIDMYNQQKIIYSDTILLILIIPGLEIIRLTFERFKANKNILKPDRNHIHHIISFIPNKKSLHCCKCNKFHGIIKIVFLD